MAFMSSLKSPNQLHRPRLLVLSAAQNLRRQGDKTVVDSVFGVPIKTYRLVVGAESRNGVLDELIVIKVIGSKVPFDIVKGKHQPTASARIVPI